MQHYKNSRFTLSLTHTVQVAFEREKEVGLRLLIAFKK